MSKVAEPIAVVTGGASGIGFAVAQRIAGGGQPVVILDVDGAAAKEAADLLPNGLGRSYECDVTDPDQVDSVARKVCDTDGRCSVLVASAGWTSNRTFLHTSRAERSTIVAVNFVGVLNVCATFLPGMVTAREGRIVLISSDAARVGTPKEAVYAGAKAAVVGFAKSLALEVARDGVTVNVVSPGSTDTPLIRRMLTEEQIQRRITANPMRRMARPEDVAYAVDYFIRREAGYVTGQVLSVNGGMTRVG